LTADFSTHFENSLYKDNRFKQLSFAVLLSNFWGAFQFSFHKNKYAICKIENTPSVLRHLF
jgi:hypothetical protein